MILQALSSLPFIWGVTLLTVTLSNPLKVDQKSISGLIIVTTLVASAATILVSRLNTKQRIYSHHLEVMRSEDKLHKYLICFQGGGHLLPVPVEGVDTDPPGLTRGIHDRLGRLRP